MSSEDFDLAGDVEQAWGRFRGRLADRIAAMEDDECLLIEMEVGADEDDLDGAAPYVQFVGWGGDLVRAEVVSNYYLDERFRLTSDHEEMLGEAGWLPPTYDPDAEADSGSANFHLDLEVREADRLAVMSVRALREVFGCAHPIFLSAEGLEIDPPGDPSWSPAVEAEATDEPVVEFPESQDDLRAMVDRALAVMFEEPVRHDGDGDVPVIAGQSAIFVRVVADAPFVELYSELVVDVTDADRAILEIGILNRDHPFAKFRLRDDTVVMSHRICAFPFAASQLRGLLAKLMDEIDDLARDLAARVDGRRFFDLPAQPPAIDESGSDADDAVPVAGRAAGDAARRPGQAGAGRRALRQRPARGHRTARAVAHRGRPC